MDVISFTPIFEPVVTAIFFCSSVAVLLHSCGFVAQDKSFLNIIKACK